MNVNSPFFSIVITVYNRQDMISSCIKSCLNQNFSNFELIVVDDASTDKTKDILNGIADQRLVIISHTDNRGINPARFTGVSNSQGEWIIIIDSDWELLPQALSVFYEKIVNLPMDIRVLRARLIWDDGQISPSFVPKEAIGYEGRIKWVEREGGTDAIMCVNKQVFTKTPYFEFRRGAMEGLYQLNLAQNEMILYLEDILGIEHFNAANSISRGFSKSLMSSLRNNAPDMLWMAETVLKEHGKALQNWGPRQYLDYIYVAGREGFYSGNRLIGFKYMSKFIIKQPFRISAWIILLLGMVSPSFVLYAIQVKRKFTKK